MEVYGLELEIFVFVISATNHGICSKRARGYSQFPEESARCAKTPALAMPAICASFVHGCWSSIFLILLYPLVMGLRLVRMYGALLRPLFRDRELTTLRTFCNRLAAGLPVRKIMSLQLLNASSTPAPG